MGNFHHKALMVFAAVSAYTAPALMTVCLLTDHWIYGNQTRLSQNTVVKPGESRVANYTFHRIGLWRECSRETRQAPYVCEIVKYSKAEAKLEKGFKAVSSASVLLIIAILLFTRGLCKRRRKAVFFISGLLFSISGLMTMVGVTLYVSITTEESVKIDQDHPVMSCSYGYSFLCAVLSFVLQELTGVLTVYWFIYRFRALVRKQEKLRERTRQLMGNCLSMTTALPLNLASMTSTNSLGRRAGHNHVQYPYMSADGANSLAYKPPRRRLPFDKSASPSTLPRMERTGAPPRSPTIAYGDYCRVLIRAEDMHLLTQMVKSKSQAQLLANSRPTTPAAPVARSNQDNPSRRNTKKGVKRTTSV